MGSLCEESGLVGLIPAVGVGLMLRAWPWYGLQPSLDKQPKTSRKE